MQRTRKRVGVNERKTVTGGDYYLILVWDAKEKIFKDSGEGPWERREQAIDFAKAECRLPWVVALVDAADSGITVSKLASRNLPLPPDFIDRLERIVQGQRKQAR